ncbi:hypothetical protein RHGRI_000471 [Rhododendron griersonianum]|uniref:Prolamin-like domain-containing protein n=1 Tax=Rhododendron griersonianum TaxID=479676 RepID=A0AAV6LGQ6_9ERIC|nr:hypothetical protein RHGRI_000471 [Rhododendron griersonianum]
MTRAATLYSVSLLAACVSILVGPTDEFLFGPGLGGLGLGNDCWAYLRGARGCGLQTVVNSFVKAQPELMGPDCCRAFLDADDKCWPKVFPLNPFFPPTLKSYCEKLDQEAKVKMAQEEKDKRDQEERDREEQEIRNQEEIDRVAQEEQDKRDQEEKDRQEQDKNDDDKDDDDNDKD